MSAATPVLEGRGLVKRFGHVVALDGADFELYPGEIAAIIGDNGAGKSTLIKTLSGALHPDEGEILLDGSRVHFRSPRDARKVGIETVYQELAVAPAHCAAIEDSQNGILSAVSAGMLVIAIPNRRYPPSPKPLGAAALVLDSLSDLTPATVESL